jgi:hypothetical protein
MSEKSPLSGPGFQPETFAPQRLSFLICKKRRLVLVRDAYILSDYQRYVQARLYVTLLWIGVSHLPSNVISIFINNIYC